MEEPFFTGVGPIEDHGWLTEWQITDGYTFQNGLQAQGVFSALGANQKAAAITARVHFMHMLQQRPIGRG